MKKILTYLCIATLIFSFGCSSFAASGEASGEVNAAVVVDGVSVNANEKYFSGNTASDEISDFEITAENTNIIGVYAAAEDGSSTISIC